MRGQHPTVEAVCEEVRKSIPSISLATVYRILNQNAEQGAINKVHVPDSPNRYDDWTSPHHHLLCGACNRLFDLPYIQLPDLALPPNSGSGHTITGVELIFRGVCAECSASNKT